jgi:hypothetical protein
LKLSLRNGVCDPDSFTIEIQGIRSEGVIKQIETAIGILMLRKRDCRNLVEQWPVENGLQILMWDTETDGTPHA